MHNDNEQEGFVHELQKKLLNDLIAAVESGDMNMSEMRESAKFILDKTQHITEAEVDGFLQELSEKWPAFKNTQVVAAGQAGEDKEKEVIDRLSAYIKDMDLNPDKTN